MIQAASMHTIINIAKIIVIILVGIVILCALAFIYIYKLRKKKAIADEEVVDYSKLNRFDTKDYVKFDDIKDGVVIFDNGYSFTAGIICYACGDFWSLPAMERLSVKKGYQSFLSTVTAPIMYKHSSRALDLSWQIKRYQKRLDEVEKKAVNMSLDYEELMTESKRVQAEGNYEGLELLVDAMENLSQKIEVEEARIKHLKDQIEYQQALASGMDATSHEQVYLFSWNYVPKVGEPELTKEEIFQRAKTELNNLAKVYISALGSAKIKARKCSQVELEILTKRHFHPVTGSLIKFSDYINSSDFDLMVRADDSKLYEEARNEALDNIDLQIGIEKFIENARENNQEKELNSNNKEERQREEANKKENMDTKPEITNKNKPSAKGGEITAGEIFYLSEEESKKEDNTDMNSPDSRSKKNRHYNKEEKHIKRGE